MEWKEFFRKFLFSFVIIFVIIMIILIVTNYRPSTWCLPLGTDTCSEPTPMNWHVQTLSMFALIASILSLIISAIVNIIRKFTAK